MYNFIIPNRRWLFSCFTDYQIVAAPAITNPVMTAPVMKLKSSRSWGGGHDGRGAVSHIRGESGDHYRVGRGWDDYGL